MARRDDSSTLTLSEKDARVLGASQVPMQIITLNDLAASGGEALPDLVKIDAEGFDLNWFSLLNLTRPIRHRLGLKQQTLARKGR